MKMPNLPQQNKKREGNFGVYLKNWMEKNPFPYTVALELKQTTDNSIPFSCIEPQQIAYALKTKSDKGAWVRVVGLDGQPDYIWLINSPAYIVIKYPHGFCFIDIETFILERDRSKRKSLTWDRAQAISVKTVII